jgi:hypothetical protein
MTRLAGLLLIAAIAVGLPTMALANDNDGHGRTLQGTYAFSGSGACLFAAGGFTTPVPPSTFTGIPMDPVHSSFGPNSWSGTYTFNHDGTGTMQATQAYIDGGTMTTGLDTLFWGFRYTLKGSALTFTYIEGTYALTYELGPNAPFSITDFSLSSSWTGQISPDGNTFFAAFGAPLILTPPANTLPAQLVCIGVHQGFKTSGNLPKH